MFPEFKEKKLSKEEKSSYIHTPIVMFTKQCGDIGYFVAFLPYKDSRVFVELGWKTGSVFPISWSGFLDLQNQIREGTFQWPASDFAIELVALCGERSFAVEPWDLYAPEVWDKNKETFREFDDRANFSQKFHIQLDWLKRGGVTEEYAQGQAALIGGDIMGCLKDYGIPFLEEAMRHHLPLTNSA